MIPDMEFRQQARLNNVPLTTIQRDYAQNWLLLFLPQMIFKGGTCLRKIYFPNYRFSDDLDFTLQTTTSLKSLTQQIQQSLRRAKEESGIAFENSFSADTVSNGYVFSIYFRILRTTGHPLKIKIDVTTKEKEPLLAPIVQKPIIHPYSDTINKQIAAYSSPELFAEKIRSLFERTRPRDLYDIWFLKQHESFDKKLFNQKCRIKNLSPKIEEVHERKNDFIQAWDNSLKHQINQLPEGSMVFDQVISYLTKTIE